MVVVSVILVLMVVSGVGTVAVVILEMLTGTVDVRRMIIVTAGGGGDQYGGG
jgi:hypothetical protein